MISVNHDSLQRAMMEMCSGIFSPCEASQVMVLRTCRGLVRTRAVMFL